MLRQTFVKLDDKGSAGLPILVFVLFALFFAINRSPDLSALAPGNAGAAEFQQTKAMICGGSTRPCLRGTDVVLSRAVDAVLSGALQLFFVSSDLDAIANLGATDKAEAPNLKFESRHFVALLVSRLLALVPVLVLSFFLFKGAVARSIFLTACFGAMFGWNAAIIEPFFNAAMLFVDWPRSYYLYWGWIGSYDWVAMGYVAGVIALLAYRARISLLSVAVVAAIGQFTIEHVGFLFGVAAAVAALADTHAERTERLRTAALRLVVAGAACVSVVGISVIVSDAHNMQPLYAVDLDKAAWFKNNFDWANLVVANLTTLIILAAVGGAVAGSIGGMLSATENAPAFARVAIISAGVFGAYLVVAFAGMWFLYYPSEMGRQFAPLSLSVAIMATSASAWAVAGIRAKS